jgi:hypothetical protein
MTRTQKSSARWLRSRRSFVAGLPLGLAAAAASSSLWSRLIRRASAQVEGQRLLVWYVADGTVPEWFWPSQAGPLSIRADRTNDLSGTNFNDTIPEADRPTFILQPVANYASNITLVRGVSTGGAGDHTPAVRSVLTGEAMMNSDTIATSPSLDVRVGAALRRQHHAAEVLRTGVYGNAVSYNGTRDLSFAGGNRFTEPSWQPVNDARLVLDAVGGQGPSGPGVDTRGFMLGAVKARVAELRCTAGTEAAQRLEAYLEEVTRLEQLQGSAAPPTAFQTALAPDTPGLSEASSNIRELNTIAPFVTELAASSLALGYSPVVTIQWGASGANQIQDGKLVDYRYDFIPGLEYRGAGDHGLAHPEDGAFKAAGHTITAAVSTRDRVRIQRWFFTQLKSLLDRLASIPDGAGTLFDTTTVLCCSEFSGPNANRTSGQHSTQNLPYLLVGGKDTPFAGGKFLQVQRNHGEYLLTLARALGATANQMGVGSATIDGIVR